MLRLVKTMRFNFQFVLIICSVIMLTVSSTVAELVTYVPVYMLDKVSPAIY